ncbi:MAG: SGNH/GDSL hydrolase family protein [Candidatus Pacebacteria bacterium]|nr:SGNH/GDSL hydrolase family protein [Candidatus Paceibacterota bacterium]
MELPELFVIGDSISIGYGPSLESMVHGVFQYGRKGGALDPLGDVVQGGDSARVLDYLKQLHEKRTFHPDVLLVNCGLHDLKTDRESGEKQIPIGMYERNLCEIARTAAQLCGSMIWVRTTPVLFARHRKVKTFDRYEADVDSYNTVADNVMAAEGIMSADLFTFTVKLGVAEALKEDGVHFRPVASRLQAAYLAGYLGRLRAGED